MYRFTIAGICTLLLLSLHVSPARSADEPTDKPAKKTLNWSPKRPDDGTTKLPSTVTLPDVKPEKRSTKSDSTDKKPSTFIDRLAAQPLTVTTPPIAPQTTLMAPNVPGQVVLPTLQPQNCPQPMAMPAPPTTRFWVRAEYLMWWTQGAEVPALVTTGGAGGVLGQPGTTVLFGNDELNDDWRSGGRLSAGIWLNPTQSTGIEGNIFALQEETSEFSSTATAPNFLARPFFNIQIPGEDARLVPGAGFTTGGIAIRSSTELQGAELMLRQMINVPARNPVAFLIGYRYLRLDDDLVINESQTGPGPSTISLFDSFDTENTFHGGEVGVITELRRNRWTLELLGKLALGNTHSEVTINGATTTTIAPAAPVTTVGGLLAQSSNIGTFEQDDFSVVPELGATLGFDVTERLRATVGYTFLYWSRVVRAGDQIDRDINLPPVPGPNTFRPQFAFETTDFWAHGLNVGLEYAF